MKILVVEDDKNIIKDYQTVIANFNEKNPDLKIKTKYVPDIKSGLKALKEEEFDGAIIDLNLPVLDPVTTGTGSIYNKDGEKILESISADRRFPVAVVSGFAGGIDEKYKEMEGLFLRIYKRGDEDIDKILSEFVHINKVGIAKIFGRTGEIEKSIDKIYYGHIQSVCGADKNNEITKDGILRYFSMVLQEYLELQLPDSFDKYSSFEFYISPCVKEFHFTGEIIKKSKDGIDDKYVILTPACDMVPRDGSKCKNNIVCVKIINGRNILEIENKTDKNYLEKNIKTNKNQRYHYLPEVSGIMGENSFIDFRDIKTFDKLDDNTVKSIATISAPFLKDIIARFSHYYSRQGQPELQL